MPAIIVCAAIVIAAAILLVPRLAKPPAYSVAIQVVAPGYGDDDSDLPLLVEGETASGNQVRTVTYVRHSGGELELEPGDYTVSLAASPLCESGDLYRVVTPVRLSIPETAGSSGEPVSCPPVQLERVPASEVTSDQIQAAHDAAIDSGFDTGKADEYAITAQAVAEEAQPGSGGGASDKAHVAFAGKLRELVDRWGYPEARKAGGAYIAGLAYARLVDFGDGQERLVVSYYDPSGDRPPWEPGGSVESYPVEVWEYDSVDGGLQRVYDGIAQLEGQNSYCSCIGLSEIGGCFYLKEWENIPGPSGHSSNVVHGLTSNGSFGVVAESNTSQEYDSASKTYTTKFAIDGQPASEQEMNSYIEKWMSSGGDPVYLTALDSSDRSIQPAIDQTKATIALLEDAIEGDRGEDSSSDAPDAVTAIDTLYYTVSIPATWGEFTYSVDEAMHPASAGSRSVGSGCEAHIEFQDGEFSVLCLEDGYPPQGAIVYRSVGSSALLPGYTVYVVAVNPDYRLQETSGASRGIGDSIDELVSLVTVKEPA